jgi:cell division septum initiation protein DivIVA
MNVGSKDGVVMVGGREFKRVKNGLDEAEIKSFIDELIKERDELAQPQHHITSLTKLAETTIVEADRLAKQIKAEAIEQAKAEGASIIDKAREQGQQTAERKQAEILKMANEKAQAIQSQAEKQSALLLEGQRDKIRDELRNFVSQQFGYLLEKLEGFKQQATAIQSDFDNNLSQVVEEKMSEIAGQKTPETAVIAEQKTPETTEISGEKMPETTEIAGEKTPESAEITEEKTPETAEISGEKMPETTEIAEEKTPESAEITEEKTPETAEVSGEKTPESAEITGQKTPETAEVSGEKTPELAEITEQKKPETAEFAGEKTPETAEITGEKSAETAEITEETDTKSLKDDKVPDESLEPIRDLDQTDKSFDLASILQGEDQAELGEPQWEVAILPPVEITKVMEVMTHLDQLHQVANTEMIVPQIDTPSILVFLREEIDFIDMLKKIPSVAYVEEVTTDEDRANGKPRKARIGLSENSVPREDK